ATGGPHHALGFNILGDPGIMISGLTTGFSVNSLSPTSLSGYGNFDDTIDCNGGTPGCGNGGNNPNHGPLQFNVTLTGAGTLTPSDFIANGAGWFFASDIMAGKGKTRKTT